MTRAPRRGGEANPENGFALIIVLLVLSLLFAVVAEFAQAMRLEGVTASNFRDSLTTAYLAEAGYHRAVAELLPEAVDDELDPKGLLAFRRTRAVPPEAPSRLGIRLSPGWFSYRITDETARLDLNRTAPETLLRLLADLGVERAARDVVMDSILDWRDSDEEHRLNGAESDYYLALPVPYRSKNGNFDSVDELLQVRGMTRGILYGRPEAPGLADYLTVGGSGAINVNTVSATVLKALGFAQPEVDLLVAGRPYVDLSRLSTQLRRGSLRTLSDIFRIEAWGEVAGQRGRVLRATVQRKTGSDGVPRVVPINWTWALPNGHE